MNPEEKVVMDAFFYPKSMAVVGVSANEAAFGTLYFRALIEYGYKGDLYPVNPKGGSFFGKQAYPSVTDIPGNVDLAVISVPGKGVPGVLETCIQKGIKAAIVLSAGFSETGEEGKKLEQEMAAVAAKGIRVMGPNCFGVYCPAGGLTLLPGSKFARESGSIGLIAQSGQFSEMIIGQTKGLGFKFSKAISYGNAMDINECDLMEYLADDPDTKVIVCYIEGVKQGSRFLDVVKKTSRVKPVLIWKSGMSKTGSKAASSHTGSLAGSEAVWNTFFNQTGAIRISSVEDIIDNTIAALNVLPLGGPRVGMVSGSGGGAVAGADALEHAGLELPTFPPEVQEKITSFLPPIGLGVRNPVDLSAPAMPTEVIEPILEDIAAKGNVDVILLGRMFLSVSGPHLILGLPKSSEIGREGLREIPIKIKEKYGIPVVVTLGEESTDADMYEFEIDRRQMLNYYFTHGVPAFPTMERGITALANVVKYKERFGRTASNRAEQAHEDRDDITSHAPHNALSEIESKRMLKEAGIPVVETVLAASGEEAAAVSEKIGYPVVLKIMSPDITHKTDAGGVKLGLATAEEVKSAYEQIVQAAKNYDPQAVIDGVSVQKMAEPGIEVIVGMTRDPQFGPVVMFGLGGVQVELLKDVAFRIVPLEKEDASRMIREIKSFKLLDGYRGKEKADIASLEDILLKLSSFINAHPEIKELDLNPIFVYRDGAVAVDARIIL